MMPVRAAVIAVVVTATGVAAAQTADEREQAALERAADALDRAADAIQTDAERRDRPATAADVTVACQLARRFHDDFAATRRAKQELDRDRLAKLRWRALPAKATCGGRGLTFVPAGFGAFVTAIARGDGGRIVGVRGGWQLAEDAGGGGECLYRREQGGYRLTGCVQTWVS